MVNISVDIRERRPFRLGRSPWLLFRSALVCAVLLPILLTSCSSKRPILTRSDRPGPSAEGGKRVATGLDPYTGHHLHGWREAEAAYEEVYGNSPDPTILHKEKIADHVERHPGFAELLLYQGSRLLEEARYAEAIDSMTEAVRLVPEYTKAMVGLGEFHLRSLHLYQRALRYFEDALTWDPQNIWECSTSPGPGETSWSTS